MSVPWSQLVEAPPLVAQKSTSSKKDTTAGEQCFAFEETVLCLSLDKVWTEYEDVLKHVPPEPLSCKNNYTR